MRMEEFLKKINIKGEKQATRDYCNSWKFLKCGRKRKVRGRALKGVGKEDQWRGRLED